MPYNNTQEPRISRRTLLQGALATIAAASPGVSGLLAAALPPIQTTATDLVSLVNVMQGTDSNWGFSRGSTLPLITRPFGMTHWSPQNKVPDGWFFDPNLHQIQGIRATHQPSPWMGDYAHFTVMAQAGPAALGPEARISVYRKEDLEAGPDYLSVVCTRDGTRLEVSGTERCAIFRFTFPATGDGRVIIDADAQAALDATHHTLSGAARQRSGSVPDNFACYFYAEFDRPFTKAYLIQDGQPLEAQTTHEGKNVGVVAEFGPAPQAEMRVGTSFISVAQAKQNLQREIGTRPFDAVRAESAKVWNETLGVVRVTGGTPTQRRTFYSCLYRAHLFPRLFYEQDAAGKPVHYSPFDGHLHDGVMYTDTGLWDGYHTIYPLLSLIQPERLGEMAQGFVNAYKEGGWLPQWPHPGYHGGMGGTHSDVVLTEAILKDIPGLDREAAFAGMWKNATVPPTGTAEGRGGLADYLRCGYLPVGSAGAVVSNSLDFAYDDGCIALAAAHLGHLDKQQELAQRALGYRHLFDPVTGFMRPKHADGSWQAGFDEFAWGDAYTEGGPWQWSLSVPHDPAGLMTLLGGQKGLTQKLDRMLWQPPLFHPGGYGHEIHEMSEMAAVKFGQYSQGNQPVHQVLAHYIAAGSPSRMQFWSRRVLDKLYTPESFPGDEDNGEMAAWYVLGALGLFPHCPGRPSYVFGSPLFPEVVIAAPGQKPLTLRAPAASRRALYVTQVAFNGRPQERLWISHAALRQGGHLDFTMAARPVSRTIAPGDLPPSQSAYAGMAARTEAVPLEIAISCGGAADGLFVGDCFVEGGSAASLETGPTGTTLPVSVAQTQRRGTFAYRIPLPMLPGHRSYTVRLCFAGSQAPTKAASFGMDVHLNGVPRLSHFDSTAETGSSGLVFKKFSGLLPNTDGEVLIEFSPAAGSPPEASSVNAILITSA